MHYSYNSTRSRRRRANRPLPALSPARACPTRRMSIFMTSYRSFWISWGPGASLPAARPVSRRFLLFLFHRAFRINSTERTTFAQSPGAYRKFCALEVFGFFDNPISKVWRKESKKKNALIVRRKRIFRKFGGARNVRPLFQFFFPPSYSVYVFIYLFIFCRPWYSKNIVV